MKILILAIEITPYFSNNYKQLIDEGHELLVFHLTDENSPNYLHNELDSNGIKNKNFRNLRVKKLINESKMFNPDVILCSGWQIKPFLLVCLFTKARTVLLTDSKWQASFRQKIAIKLRKILIAPFFDYAFVPGTPQEEFMVKLGFQQGKVFKGLFNLHAVQKEAIPISQASRCFLYIGRLSAEKGIVRMLEGFKLYRTLSDNPFELRIAGVGELLNQASLFDGVNLLGYVPNSKLPGLIQDSKALVLFSEREPWGVVIAESVANFRPVICSDACGAAVDLVEHGKNGWILKNPTPEDIADKFLDFELTSLLELENMSRASFEFANLYGPNTWIDFLEQITA